MKCPFCGKELEDGSKFCSACGASLEPTNSNNNQIKESAETQVVTQVVSEVSTDILTPENFRNAPHYRSNLLKMVIFGGIAFLFSALGLLGSILFRFGDKSNFDIVLMILGMVVGLGFFIAAMSFNRKTFPNSQNVKMKGIEFLVPIFIAFTLVCLVMALAAQGFYFIIY